LSKFAGEKMRSDFAAIGSLDWNCRSMLIAHFLQNPIRLRTIVRIVESLSSI
jgi:hypothetical protein